MTEIFNDLFTCVSCDKNQTEVKQKISFVPLSNKLPSLSRQIFFSVIGLYYALYIPIMINFFVKYSWQFYGQLIFEIIIASNGIFTPLVYVWHSQTFKLKMLEMYEFRKLQTDNSTRTQIGTISA